MKAQSGQWIEFLLGRTRCAIPILSAREIVKSQGITRLPDQPPAIEGIIDLRGEILPVVDMSARFGSSGPTDLASRRIIVVFVGDQAVGLHVDEVTRIRRFVDEDIGPIPKNAGSGVEGLVRGVAKTPEGLVLLWDPGHVLSLDELDRLGSLSADQPGRGSDLRAPR